MSANNISECCTCGYRWITGQDGSHSCTVLMAETINKLKEEICDLTSTRCGDCLDTGILNNRVEGDHLCTCITETEAYDRITDPTLKHKDK